MREDLALKHLLLNEIREIEKQTNLAQVLKQLGQSLTIEYLRADQLYLIKAIIENKEVVIKVEKKDFEFYQRADTEKSLVREKKYSIGQDPNATDNQQKARKILSKLLSQANVTIPTEILIQQDNKFIRNIDWSAWLIVSLIAIASAFLTYYQGSKTFNLIDNTYTLESAWRILNGEVPYRDFNLVVMPGVYLKQALLMKLFGNYAILGLWWSMIAMAITVLLTHKVLRLMDTPRSLAVSLCLIAATGGNIFRPYVWYDVDAIILCLGSAALFLWSEKKTSFTKHVFSLGFLTALPLIFKQNLGLAHLVIISSIVYFQWLVYPTRFSWQRFFYYHLGIILALSMLVIPFWYLGAFSQLLDYTFVSASKLRMQKSIVDVFLATYPKLIPNYYLLPPYFPLPVFSTSFLTWGAMLFGGFYWFVGTHRSIFQLFLPFWILGLTISGVYALGAASIFPLMPLMAIMIALVWDFIRRFSIISRISYVIHIVVILLVIILVQHALAGYQLFFYRNAFTSPTPFKVEALKGMSSSPEIVAQIEQLVSFVNQIPKEETIVLLETEDPIYFLTNRRSPLSILQRYKSSGGDPETVYLPALKKAKPTWVIIKRRPQFSYGQKTTELEKIWLTSNYKEFKLLNYYSIWKRIEPET